MWSKIGNNIFDSISGTTVYLKSSTSNIREGNWLIFNPGTYSTQIRKVEKIISATSVSLNLPLNTDKLLPFNPSFSGFNNLTTPGYDIYIQSTPCWDITLFGAGENKSSIENTLAINAASTDCNNVGGGIVYIPKGIFLIRDLNSGDPFYNASVDGSCIDMQGRKNIKFIGDGMGVSTIKLEKNVYLNSNDNPKETHIFNCISSGTSLSSNFFPVKNLEWHDLTIDGNRYDILKQISVGEQAHSIRIDGGNSIPGSFNPEIPNVYNNIVIKNVEFKNSPSDGIFLIYTVNVNILDCKFISPGRSGVTIQAGTGNIIIKNNYFFDANDQDIDFEPTGAGKSGRLVKSPTKFIVTENTFIKSLRYSLGVTLTGKDNSISGFGSSIDPTNSGPIDTNESYIISKNIFKGACLYVANVRNLNFINNIISTGIDGNEAIQSIKNMEKVLIKNNIIINRNQKNTVLYFIAQSSKTVQDINITGNTILQGSILFENCQNVSVNYNKIKERNKPFSAGITYKITVSPTVLNEIDFGNISILNNQITGSGRQAIFLPQPSVSTKSLQNIMIKGNIIEGEDLIYGIQIKRPSNDAGGYREIYWDNLSIKNNLIGDSQNKKIDVQVMAYLTSNNTFSNYYYFDNSNQKSNPGTSSVYSQFFYANQGSLIKNNSLPADNIYVKNIQSRYNSITKTNSIEQSPIFNLTNYPYVYNWQGWDPISEIDKQKLYHDVFVPNPGKTSLDDHDRYLLNTFTSSNWWTELSSNWAIDTDSKSFLGGRIVYSSSNNDATQSGLPNDRISQSVFNTLTENNIIIKGLFYSTGYKQSGGGIIFRSSGSVTSYWRFYLINDPNLENSNYKYIRLEIVKSSSLSEKIAEKLVDIDDTGLFLLTVKLNNEVISVYFNDLLITTVYNSYNLNETRHGLLYRKGPDSKSDDGVFCKEFKLLSL